MPIRGNIPRLGKRTDMLIGSTLGRSIFNQDANGPMRLDFVENIKTNEDSIWPSRMNKIKNDIMTNFDSGDKKSLDMIEAIQVSLYNLLTSIIKYKKEAYDESQMF